MSGGYVLFTTLIALFTLAAAICDYRTRRIPNWLTVPFLLLGLGFNAIWQDGIGLPNALLGFLTGFGLLFVLWVIGGGGGGDVKLMAALGAWLGPKLTLFAFLFSAALVLLASIVVLVAGLARRAAEPTGTKAARLKRRVPFALPLAAGTWLVLAWKMVV